jgi:hypothetical protein
MRTLALVVLVAACGPAPGHHGGGGGGVDGNGGSGSGSQAGCGGSTNCFSVYAHSNDTLYLVDLTSKSIQRIGNFGISTSMTDLAVAPDNTIYTVSNTALYTVSPTTGAATMVGSTKACGSQTVALTTLPNGQIWAGDFQGALCQIDISTNPPTVKPPIKMANNLALSGDMVALGDGTVFGTAYKLSDGAGQGTQNSNVLVKIDLTTGSTTMLGTGSGYPNLYGTSFAQNQVFGFTHDNSGRVVTIDPTTGAGTMYATFSDPMTGKPISFAGAGVNSLVVIE